ncbi:MAG: hypothetical protein WCD18_01380 [Thermosynechococcaceae cyanobacterium]
MIDPLAVAGLSLWALAFYLSFAGWRYAMVAGLSQWFDFAERSLYLSESEFEKTRSAREARNAFWASILGILPFLFLGSLCYFGLAIGLSQNWSISLGAISAIASGLYELGRNSQ